MEILRSPSLPRILVLGPATEHMFIGIHDCMYAIYTYIEKSSVHLTQIYSEQFYVIYFLEF